MRAVGVALAVVAAAASIAVAGLANAAAEPTGAPAGPSAAASSPVSSAGSSPLATPTGAATTSTGLSGPGASVVPTPSPHGSPEASLPPPAANQPASHPRPAPAKTVTATFDNRCSNYGWDVANTTAVAHSLTLVVAGSPVGGPAAIAPGATVHVGLDQNTPPATEVELDSDGGTLDRLVVRFCTSVTDISATIGAASVYTKGNFIAPATTAPHPKHGVVTTIALTRPQQVAIRYAPDPCFAGTDSFGYSDFILAVQGVISVTVLPGPCRVTVRRSAIDCATGTAEYSATNPYPLPAHIVAFNSAANAGPVKDLIVPAHGTAVIDRVTLDVNRPVTARLSFTVRNTKNAAFTDNPVFPCASATDRPSATLAETGSASRQLAGFGAASVVIGAILTWVVRPRRAVAGRSKAGR